MKIIEEIDDVEQRKPLEDKIKLKKALNQK